MSPRQEAFEALKDLFTALVTSLPERHLTEVEVIWAAQVLKDQFNEIMDRYDERRDRNKSLNAKL